MTHIHARCGESTKEQQLYNVNVQNQQKRHGVQQFYNVVHHASCKADEKLALFHNMFHQFHMNLRYHDDIWEKAGKPNIKLGPTILVSNHIVQNFNKLAFGSTIIETVNTG